MRQAVLILTMFCSCAFTQGQIPSSELPDSPGFRFPWKRARSLPVPCQGTSQMAVSAPEAMSAQEVRTPCLAAESPYRRFADSTLPTPMTPRQKGLLAVSDVIDPFNLFTIGGNAAFTVGINSHSAFGPGMRGFGKLVGVSFLQDATGEFIGTFAVCSLLHQDPRYHRDPQASVPRRLLHAVEHTVIARHDDGSPMPNYENLITYPASAEISNLYVPGIHGNAPSTVARVLTGLATDPVNNIITEFLPDFARRVHIRVVFVQQILNNIASDQQIGVLR